MKTVLRKSWPQNIPSKLVYRHGEQPLFKYLSYNAENHGNDVAYVYYGNEITWKKLSDDVNRLANYLQKNNVKKGDYVALFMQNSPQYLISHYAIQKLGGVVVPLNPMYKQAELTYFFKEVELSGLIVGQELFSLVEDLRGKIALPEILITTNYADYFPDKAEQTLPIPEDLNLPKATDLSSKDLLEIIENEEPLEEDAEVDLWNDVCLLVFTSGTTGRPKGAMLTYGNALFKTAAMSDAKSYDENTTTAAMSPLFHIAGMLLGVNMPVYTRCKTVLITRFDVETAIQAIEKYRINAWYTIATMNWAILHHPGVEERDFSSLKTNQATSFGIPVNEQLAADWKKLTGGCELMESSYGLSETHTADTFMPEDKVKHGTCGIPTYDTEIRIIDAETNEDLAPGEQGEIVVRNPGVFKGYLNNPEATNATLQNGWVHTGDIGKIDEDGFLYFLGRKKEMIKSSGFSVFPEDVEALMKENDKIAQVAAVGVADEMKGEIIKAFIVLKPEFKGKITSEELISWAKDNMAAFKCPKVIEFRDELPVTSAGKVLRRLLIEEE